MGCPHCPVSHQGGVGWGTHPCRRVHGIKVNLEIVLRPGICGVRGVSRDARGGDGGHKAAPPNPMGVTEDPPPTHPPLFWRVKLPGRLHVSGMSSYHFCFIAFCMLETRGGGYMAGGHHQQVQPFPGPPPAPPPAPRKGPRCTLPPPPPPRWTTLFIQDDKHLASHSSKYIYISTAQCPPQPREANGARTPPNPPPPPPLPSPSLPHHL